MYFKEFHINLSFNSIFMSFLNNSQKIPPPAPLSHCHGQSCMLPGPNVMASHLSLLLKMSLVPQRLLCSCTPFLRQEGTQEKNHNLGSPRHSKIEWGKCLFLTPQSFLVRDSIIYCQHDVQVSTISRGQTKAGVRKSSLIQN